MSSGMLKTRNFSKPNEKIQSSMIVTSINKKNLSPFKKKLTSAQTTEEAFLDDNKHNAIPKNKKMHLMESKNGNIEKIHEPATGIIISNLKKKELSRPNEAIQNSMSVKSFNKKKQNSFTKKRSLSEEPFSSRPNKAIQNSMTVKSFNKKKQNLFTKKRALSEEPFSAPKNENVHLLKSKNKQISIIQEANAENPSSIGEDKENKPKSAVAAKWKKSSTKKTMSRVHNLKDGKGKSSPFSTISLNEKGKPGWKNKNKEALDLKRQHKEKEATNYDVVFKAKQIWEKVRRVNCAPEQKAELIASLYNLTKDHLIKLVAAQDTSRIIQWILKHGSPGVRYSICHSLMPVIIEISQKPFSCLCVINILKYGDKNSIKRILDMFNGNVKKLMTNAFSAPILEYAFSTHASTEQKKALEAELFGSSWKVCVGLEVESLKEVTTLPIEIRNDVFQETKENIIRVITKNNTASSLLHSVTSQFLEVCSAEDKEEILSLLSSHILNLVESEAGFKISLQCCWLSSKKTKKSIISQLKGNVKRVCLMEYGHLLVLTLLDSTDDTVLLKNVILKEILNDIIQIVDNDYGKEVVIYLVCHRDSKYFHSQILTHLEKTDIIATTLKSTELRRSEILRAVMYSLLSSVYSNVNVWMKDGSVAMLMLSILKLGSGKLLNLSLDAIAKHVCSDAKIEGMFVYEHPGMNLILRKLLKYDENRENVEEMFSYHLANILDKPIIKKWVTCNRGSFLLVEILETKKNESITILLSKITEKLRLKISESQNVGAKVLNKLLREYV